MAQYIDKSALVAEIERRENICKKVVLDLRTEENKDYYQGKAEAYSEILELLNTLEVKEVDLEKELCTYLKMVEATDEDIDFVDFTKHFFELGLKTQNDNIRHSMNEPPNYPCDILFVTDVNNMFLYRYMENGRPVDIETPYFRDIENGKCWYYCNDILNIH